MTEISEKAFFECKSLMLADGKNITEIGSEAFRSCYSLYLINFANTQIVHYRAFAGCMVLSGVSFPKCKTLSTSAFSGCISLRSIDFPELDYAAANALFGCVMLNEISVPSLTSTQGRQFNEIEYVRILDLPSLKVVNKNTFYWPGMVYETQIERLEFSNVEKIYSIPLGIYENLQKRLSIVLPSSFEMFKFAYKAWNETNPNMLVYGSRGTYAEQWAKENDFDFIEITPETAVITDLPDEFYDYMRYLFADVVGFNRTYQWYGSYTDQNTNGTLIEGATERKFVPKENEQYPYYYCVVNSTDVGYDPIEIRTGASKYMNYTDERPAPADYSALDEILATIPEDLSIYSDETVTALNEIINGINRNLDAADQDTVDGYVEAVSNAISNLKLKEYTVSFIADGETILKYGLEQGKEITEIPPAPAKEGYVFKEWLPDIPEKMPAENLTIYAVFEEIKQPDDNPPEEIKPSIGIQGFEYSRTVDYRTTITFTAITGNMPKDAAVVWYKDGEKAGTGDIFTVSQAKDAFTVQAKIVDESGNILSSSETELIKVKTDFFSKIIAFLKSVIDVLFGC